jgi:hypothetical protein
MSEKFYIVSESELATLIMVSMDAAHSHMPEEEHGLLNEVKAACRARPVPDWAEEFAGPVREDYDESECYSINRRIQRIKP